MSEPRQNRWIQAPRHGEGASVVEYPANARLEVVPGGGHRPDIRSPELVNPLLLEFLLAG